MPGALGDLLEANVDQLEAERIGCPLAKLQLRYWNTAPMLPFLRPSHFVDISPASEPKSALQLIKLTSFQCAVSSWSLSTFSQRRCTQELKLYPIAPTREQLLRGERRAMNVRAGPKAKGVPEKHCLLRNEDFAIAISKFARPREDVGGIIISRGQVTTEGHHRILGIERGLGLVLNIFIRS
jgi:hypothetical protein